MLKQLKIFLLFIAFCSSSTIVISQKNESIEKGWSDINILLDSIENGLHENPAHYKKLIDSTLRLCIYHDYKEGETEAKNLLGNYYSLKGDHEQGRKYLVFAQREKIRLELPAIQIALVDLDIGNTWYREGMYDNAMRKYLEAMNVFDRNKDSLNMLKGYSNIAKVHLALEQYDKAEGYLKEMLKTAINLNEKDKIAQANNLLGELYQTRGDLTNAEFYFKNALEINLSIQNKNGIAHGYNNMAILHYYKGDLAQAKNNFNSALKLRISIGNPLHISESYRNIGSLFYFENDYIRAIEYFKKGLSLAKSSNAADEIITACFYISDSYKKAKQSDSAFIYLEYYQYYNDSILRHDKKELVADLEFKYQNEKLERKNEDLQNEKKLEALEKEKLKQASAYDQYKIISLSILMLLIVLISIYVAYSNFNKSKLNKSLKLQKSLLEEKNLIIESKSKEIISSIEYAQNLQNALLPKVDNYEQYFSSVSLLYIPRDIVSGDFYWQKSSGDEILFAVGDCTGHGVPGAMLSVMAHNIMDNIYSQKPNIEPNEFLNELNQSFTNYLYLSHKQASDGIDMTIARYNVKTKQLSVSGAVNSVFIIKNNELEEIKSNRKSIGGITESNFTFSQQTFNVEEGTSIFMYSDGYQDQFGGENGKKFRRQNFRKIIQKVAPFKSEVQEQILHTTIDEWMGDFEQLDDIVVMGFKV